MYTANCNPTIHNNVVTQNSAVYGGGICIRENPAPTLINNILWNNTATNENEIYLYQATPIVMYCDVSGGWQGEGNINIVPNFRDPLNGDFHLMATYCGDPQNSPCIDVGSPIYLDSLLDCSWGLGTTSSDMGAYGGGLDAESPSTIHIPDDYPTIQLGIDATNDGDTVLVHPGIYYENGF